MKRELLATALLGTITLPFLCNINQTFAVESGTNRPTYQIDATYLEKKDIVKGHMSVTLPEIRNGIQNEVYFRLYPNVFQDWKYNKEAKPSKEGHIAISHVKVDGVKQSATINDTVMKVRLPKPLQKGRSAKIELDYKLYLPHGGTRLNKYKNTAFLAQWYPMLAVKDKDGWHTEPYTTTGDPFYSTMSDFDVTFHVPKGYQVISTAKDIHQTKENVHLQQYNVRDFVAVLTKDYQVLSRESGTTRVNLWYTNTTKDVSEPLLNAAVDGLRFYGNRFGHYPYQEVDVVLGETGYGIAGMEYPGLVTSLPKVPTSNGISPAVNVVVHELAHQWWYGVVGNNQAKEPWLDEGLTTFSEFLYMQKRMKQDDAPWLKRVAIKTDEIHRSAGITSAQRLYDYPDELYGIMVYLRPAAMMFALMDEIGEKKVMKILNTYYHQYQFKIATTSDFLRIANQVAGKNLTPFFEKWLYFKG
ncbi:M1 family metallopeptidase [Shimazuella sp. AN120528]|uniref:M1 family metallopeptidase n=1 Tax=Shimazuella soli TaxID=1892854 RepID=UPI001F0D06C8|nr:M1 family metallopeptidase [Shimazuella soli]MCH5583893.1 M1 family metallopeptidase [Shimazuella soli]